MNELKIKFIIILKNVFFKKNVVVCYNSVDMDQRVGRYRLLSDGGMIDVL